MNKPALVAATVFALPWLAGAITGRAEAAEQVLALADPKAFYEAYLDAPSQTSRGSVGVSIVGIHLSGKPVPFDPRAVRFMLGEDTPKASRLCVRMLSRDGRYFAQGTYRLDDLRDATPQVDFTSRYASQLKEYSSGDMAVSATVSKSCADTKGATLYAIDQPPGEDARALVVQIRAGDARVRAQLGQDNRALGPTVMCARPEDGPTVGFSAECVLPLPERTKPGLYQLSLGETAASGEIMVKTYPVSLWSPPAARSQ